MSDWTTNQLQELLVEELESRDQRIAELESKITNLREVIEDAAEGFEGAAQGHGIDFYAYTRDMREAAEEVKRR